MMKTRKVMTVEKTDFTNTIKKYALLLGDDIIGELMEFSKVDNGVVTKGSHITLFRKGYADLKRFEKIVEEEYPRAVLVFE